MPVNTNELKQFESILILPFIDADSNRFDMAGFRLTIVDLSLLQHLAAAILEHVFLDHGPSVGK